MDKKTRTTKQREVILEILSRRTRPISAVEISTLAQKKISSINKTTIYRTLERLEESGTIAQVTVKAGIAYYELVRQHDDHQHFVCDKCEGVYCIGTPLKMAIEDFEMPKGFILREKELLLRGLCPKCNE
jgi:Fur family ferric uptake transcriptional regulator